jgi:large subunit ribosomal protein L25
MTDFELTATSREDKGKGASRRLRRLAGQIPAIIYGGKKEPEAISLLHKDIAHSLDNEAFYSHIVTINIEGKGQDVILKDVQRHPAKPIILHVDFQRVSKDQKLTTRVPLHFINEDTCVGVKMEGGQIAHIMTDMEISCLPANLPEYLEVDMAEVALDVTLHISDITLPEGVESVALSHGEEQDQPIASVHMPKVIVEEEDLDDEAEEDAEAEEGAEDTDDSEEKPED